MRKKWRRAVAAALMAAMLVQQCAAPVAAAEPESQAVTETELQTQAPTEAQPQETDTVETQPESVPETQEQAVAETQTEGATEAGSPAETQTESAGELQTEGVTEAPAETQPQTAAETETETERSGRVNTGGELGLGTLQSMLSGALPYLFVAKRVGGEEELLAALEEKGLLPDSAQGSAILSALDSVPRTLANASSSAEVTVINLYANADGTLDTTQLDRVFSDRVIDVTNRYYVVNIIADSASQALSFSGYTLKRSGNTVDYADETEAGNIVYSFAAMAGDTFTDYTGALKLSGNLQGTFLAPKASVEVSGALAGAVYADAVAVQASEDNLLRIVFLTGVPQGQAEAVMERSVEEETEDVKAETDVQAEKTIRVSAQVFYEETQLTAEQDIVYYVALFTGTGANRTRVSEVQEIALAAGADTGTASFDGLDDGTYYILATDASGEILQETQEQKAPAAVVTLLANDTDPETEVSLQYQYYTGYYPDGMFSYTAQVDAELQLLDRDGGALASDEAFYVMLYRDAKLQTPMLSEPAAISPNGSSSGTVNLQIKMTQAQEQLYLAETDSTGAALSSDSFAYTVSYPGNAGKDCAAVTVGCGLTGTVKLQNKQNDSVVKIAVTDSATGSLLAGATLALRDSSGELYTVASIGSDTFSSDVSELVLVNELADGETYYITEITAPGGYLPASDTSFTVAKGLTTEVILENTAVTSTGYSLSVAMEVYAGDTQAYAYDTTSGTYAANGAYTYYLALFSDAAHTQKVSDVVSVHVSGFTGSVIFKDLIAGGVYYVAETDRYGVPLGQTDALTIKYTDNGEVTMSGKSRTITVQNVYAELPAGYRYTGVLNLKLNVTDSSGTAEAVTKTFYVGIYREADYSDAPTVVTMKLQNASSVSVRRRILLSGSSDMTYYIAEVDANGKRVTASSEFPYTVTIDQPVVTVSKGGNQTVTVTNKAISTKATLYITKRVYEGAELKAVNETFYAGLFKDSSFTELYADPVALKLENKSELTLKLTLNLGSAAGTTIYVAEVDKDGNIIKNQKSFGYQIKIVNATAAFTQDNLEIQAILLNSAYGTTSEDDWNMILSSDVNKVSSGGAVSENGTAFSDGTSVQTGDNTPLSALLALMGISLVVMEEAVRRLRRKKRRQ